MRNQVPSILAAALLLLGAGSAGAFSINHTTNYDGVSDLVTSDTVTVHVCSDTEGASVTTAGVNPGLSNLSVGIVFAAPNLVYIPAGGALASTYAYLNDFYPPTYPSPTYQTPHNGSQSSYLLYTLPQPAAGAFPGQPGYAYMVAAQTPWITWPAPPPGYGQVNLNWIPPGALPDCTQPTRGSTNPWLGSLVLHVASTPSMPKVGVFVDGTCCSVRTGDGTEHRAVTTVDALTVLPEPSGPALSMAAIATLYALRSLRRSRRRS